MRGSGCTKVKTRVWNKAGIPPQNVEDSGPEVWQPSKTTVLETPIGSELYISEKLDERLAKERALWEAIPTVPDLQCAWQILLQSANPRTNHTIRTKPPSCCAAYCSAHDEGIWNTAKVLLDVHPEGETQQLATLPMRMGGLGLRSAVRCSPAAFWVSWADALQMISERTPDVANDVVRKLSNEEPQDGCLGELRAAANAQQSE